MPSTTNISQLVASLQTSRQQVVLQDCSKKTVTIMRRVYTRKNAKLLQVCKQVVTSLFTSCQQVVFALLIPSLL